MESAMETRIGHFLPDFLDSFSGAFAKLRIAIISIVMSVRLSAWNISARTGPIFMTFYIELFLENLSRKFVLLKFDTNNGCFT